MSGLQHNCYTSKDLDYITLPQELTVFNSFISYLRQVALKKCLPMELCWANSSIIHIFLQIYKVVNNPERASSDTRINKALKHQ